MMAWIGRSRHKPWARLAAGVALTCCPTPAWTSGSAAIGSQDLVPSYGRKNPRVSDLLRRITGKLGTVRCTLPITNEQLADPAWRAVLEDRLEAGIDSALESQGFPASHFAGVSLVGSEVNVTLFYRAPQVPREFLAQQNRFELAARGWLDARRDESLSPEERASELGFGNVFQGINAALASCFEQSLSVHLDARRALEQGTVEISPNASIDDESTDPSNSFDVVRIGVPDLLAHRHSSINFAAIELTLIPVVNRFGEGVDRHSSSEHGAELTTRHHVVNGNVVTRSHYVVNVSPASPNSGQFLSAVVDVEFVVEYRFADSQEWHEVVRERSVEDPLLEAVKRALE